MLSSVQRNVTVARSGQLAYARPTCPLRRCARAHAASSASRTKFTLRPGKPSDLPVIWRMVVEEWMNPFGLDIDRFVVAEEEGHVAGFGQMEVKEGNATGPKTWELRTLVVMKPFRGQGVAPTIIDALLERAAAGDQVFLCCVAFDQHRGMYSKAGFQELTGADVPKFMELELKVGSVVARMYGYKDGCTVMGLTK